MRSPLAPAGLAGAASSRPSAAAAASSTVSAHRADSECPKSSPLPFIDCHCPFVVAIIRLYSLFIERNTSPVTRGQARLRGGGAQGRQRQAHDRQEPPLDVRSQLRC